MKRRAFLTLLGGAAVAWPLAAEAQQAGKIARIGILTSGPSGPMSALGYPAFFAELRQRGFTEGQNLVVERRSVEDTRASYALASELIQSKVDLLVAIGPEAPLQAAVAASRVIPIVMMALNYDPIALGYVASLARPGGNVTGVVYRQLELAEKQVELLTQAFPGKKRLAILSDAASADQLVAAEKMAKSLRLEVRSLKLENPPYDFAAAFLAVADGDPQMLLLLGSAFFSIQGPKIAEVAIYHRLPTMFNFRTYVTAGGLMSFGADITPMFRRAADYVAKILNGAKPEELPVEQATKFEMAINLKTAKAIGIELPTSILLRADEVIE